MATRTRRTPTTSVWPRGPRRGGIGSPGPPPTAPAGPAGNEILTSATATLLVVALLAEGVTVLNVRGLLAPHMFIGMVLIGPVLLKLSSTSYRMARYYTGAREYREKGPPHPLMRALAPLLVLATLAVLGTGVLMLVAGRGGGVLLGLHKASFVLWGALFAVHFLAYLPRIARSLRADWTAARRRSVPGAGARGMLVAAALGGGVALALAVLPLITAFPGAGH